MVADELRRQADHFVELQDLQSGIARLPRNGEDRRDDDDDMTYESAAPNMQLA